jgi:hypothetical protein
MTGGIAGWGWPTMRQRHAIGRSLWTAPGKVIGGASPINAQIPARGNRRDHGGRGIALHSAHMPPRSRGRVRLAPGDPAAPP